MKYSKSIIISLIILYLYCTFCSKIDTTLDFQLLEYDFSKPNVLVWFCRDLALNLMPLLLSIIWVLRENNRVLLSVAKTIRNDMIFEMFDFIVWANKGALIALIIQNTIVVGSILYFYFKYHKPNQTKLTKWKLFSTTSFISGD